MVQEGVRKYQSAVFRVPFMDKWIVVISDPRLINDVRQARDDELSFYKAVDEVRFMSPSTRVVQSR